MTNKRIIEDGNYTKVESLDDKGPGGAHHIYQITASTERAGHAEFTQTMIFFQKGAIEESGVNGCHNEDLIKIVIDRLERFQEGPFPSQFNERAIAHLFKALNVLNQRTQERIARGVEGKLEK